MTYWLRYEIFEGYQDSVDNCEIEDMYITDFDTLTGAELYADSVNEPPPNTEFCDWVVDIIWTPDDYAPWVVYEDPNTFDSCVDHSPDNVLVRKG